MRFSITLLAFILIALVLASPLPANKDSVDKDSEQNGKSSSKSSSDSASASASDNSDKNDKSDKSDKSGKKGSKSKAAASDGGASVLSSQSYSDLQISDGKAGSAEQEAAAKFQGLDKGDLSKVSDADVKLIKGIHDVAEKAEVEAFNPAIEKATGDDLKAMKIGKTKNKVLKTSATVLALEIQEAKGQKVDPAKMAKEKAKKAKNISLDKAAAGQASKGVTIDGTS
ncbi:hypothetical protein EPUL_005260 [Erysiphe pulchra]|uniref:Small secreted protein n=1 Tax=Erysiphe pulchra TaxID=225359 RepID=A0A2S4PPD0_9PEZI|nr:hypothetical protein EPUL_005260 [Erysiphe pulchra]